MDRELAHSDGRAENADRAKESGAPRQTPPLYPAAGRDDAIIGPAETPHDVQPGAAKPPADKALNGPSGDPAEGKR